MKSHRSRHSRYDFERINAQQVEGSSLNALYFPRTMTLLIITILATLYIVMKRDNTNLEKNVQDGVACVIVFHLIVSVLAFPNGPFTRPHPVIWRLVFGISVLYLLVLAFASCLHIDQIKTLLYWVDPNVRYAKREIDVVESYAVNCSTVTAERLYSTLDVFALGHFFGWVVKALSLRSYVMCWAISILWEFTELFFMDIFPNFQECWWDQIIVDVIVCNALGIFVGMKICKYLELRKYRWESIKDIHSTSGKLRRAVMQFTPRQWTSATWIGPGSSTRRIVAVFFVLFLFLLSELNTFFLKHLLRFPATHPFCWCRLILIAVAAAPSCRQAYVYMTDVTCNRMGTQAWLFVAIINLEAIISVKIGYEEFTRAQIRKVLAWIAITVLMTLASLFGLVYYAKPKSSKTENGRCYYDSTDADEASYEKSDKVD